MSHPLARVVALLALSFTCACDVASGGMGIGLPDVTGRVAAARLPLSFGRVYLPDGPTNAAARYVELVNDGDAALEVGQNGLALSLIAGGAGVALPATSWQPGAVVRVGGDALVPLGLHRHLGELGVLDANATLHAYAAWGGVGTSLPGGLGKMAEQTGLATTGAAPLAFPLARALAVLPNQGAAGACTPADVALAPPYAAEACSAEPGALAPLVTRVVPAGIAHAGASLELYNPDPTAWLDPYGLVVCTASSGCATLTYAEQNANGPAFLAPAPAGGLAADAVQAASRRRLACAGAQAVGATDLRTELPALQGNDELVLLAPGSDANGTTADALGYLRLAPDRNTGASNTPLSARIADGAVRDAWKQAAAPAPRLADEAAVLLLDAPGGRSGPAAWRLSANTDERLEASADAYTACSAPQAPVPARVRLAAVVSLSANEVRLVLQGPVPADASDANAPSRTADPASFAGLELVVGDANFMLDGALPAAPELWVNVSATADCQAAHDVCWPNASADWTLGEASVRQAGTVLAHVQWGGGGPSTRLGAAAASAGVWPGAGCREASFVGNVAGVALRLLPKRPGQGPADYVVGR